MNYRTNGKRGMAADVQHTDTRVFQGCILTSRFMIWYSSSTRRRNVCPGGYLCEPMLVSEVSSHILGYLCAH